MHDTPTWLFDLFGQAAAGVLQLLPEAVAAGHERARDAQEASGLRQLNPYGNTSWLVVFEEFVLTLGTLPGAHLMRPKGASYELVVLNGTAVCPVRVKRTTGRLEDARLKPNRIRRALSALNQLGEENQTLDLAAIGYDEDDLFDPAFIIPRDTAAGVVFVPYDVDADTGVGAVGIGQGTVLLDGAVDWVHFEELDLDTQHSAPRPVRSGVEPRFDSGAMPEPILQPRLRPVRNPEEDDRVSDIKRGIADDGTDD
jgi:hypothetical protein